MPGDRSSEYEIFISYSRRDNEPEGRGWVTGLCEHIREDHRRFSTEPLRIFFDQQDIADMDDWRDRILGGLRSSKILLVCLSPSSGSESSGRGGRSPRRAICAGRARVLWAVARNCSSCTRGSPRVPSGW